jgi:hypothetical protein
MATDTCPSSRPKKNKGEPKANQSKLPFNQQNNNNNRVSTQWQSPPNIHLRDDKKERDKLTVHVYYRREGETLHFDTVVDKHDKNGNFFFSHSPIKKTFTPTSVRRRRKKEQLALVVLCVGAAAAPWAPWAFAIQINTQTRKPAPPKMGGDRLFAAVARIPPSLSTRVRSGEKTTIVSEKLLTNEISCVWRLEIPLRRVFPWKEKKKKEGDQQFPSQNFFIFIFVFLPWSNRQWFRPCV